jgi:hypothetical protein
MASKLKARAALDCTRNAGDKSILKINSARAGGDLETFLDLAPALTISTADTGRRDESTRMAGFRASALPPSKHARARQRCFLGEIRPQSSVPLFEKQVFIQQLKRY